MSVEEFNEEQGYGSGKISGQFADAILGPTKLKIGLAGGRATKATDQETKDDQIPTT